MKPQNFFVSYILLPFLSVFLMLIFIFLNKKNSITETKKILLFTLGYILILALPGLLTFTEIDFIPLYYSIVQILYFFLGFYYYKQIDSYLNHSNQLLTKSMIILITIIIFCLGSYIFSIIFNYFGEFDYGLIASSCTYTIIIPTILNWTYKALLNIPSEIYKVWKYDTHYKEALFSSEAIDRIIVIELELSKKIDDLDSIKVKAKAPVNFLFGEWFQMFIHDHNIKYAENPILYSRNNISDEWIFYIKPTLIRGKQYIDYEKSIENNQLTNENITVVCKRVSII